MKMLDNIVGPLNKNFPMTKVPATQRLGARFKNWAIGEYEDNLREVESEINKRATGSSRGPTTG